MFIMQRRSQTSRRLDAKRSEGRVGNTGKKTKGVSKKMLEGTPIIAPISTLEKIYTFPPKCRDKHNFKDAYIHITFIEETDNKTPFPMFALSCTECGEIEQK
jgi:hypothetical protein